MTYIDILEQIDMGVNIMSKKYVYNGVFVPRVTEVLSSTLHEDYLLDWSNHLGFKRENYRKKLEWYADIGTVAHNIIEDIILKGYTTRPIKDDMKYAVSNAVNSFIEWYSVILNNKCNIISTEKTLVCKWFGGTCDLLIDINGKNYLLDFKTSKKVSFKHHLQLAAYKYVCELEGIQIDGVGVLLVSRDRIQFSENILHMDNPDHKIYMDHCIETFMSLVYAYYNRLKTETLFNKIV